MAIEARYYRYCYTKFERSYHSLVEQHQVSGNLEITIENELMQYIKEEIELGISVLPLQDLSERIAEAYQQHGITKSVNRTRLKETILEVFSNLEAEKGAKSLVFLICSKVSRKITSEAAMNPDEEARTLLMAASVLRKAVKHFPGNYQFEGHFPNHCEKSSLPPRLKYFLDNFK